MALDPEITTVAVAPTLTVLAEVDVRREGLVTVQVSNLDVAQTLAGYVQRKVAGGLGWSTSSIPDFSSIQPAGTVDAAGNPLDSVTADLDVTGTAVIRVVGEMSGAGGNAQVAVRKTGPK